MEPGTTVETLSGRHGVVVAVDGDRVTVHHTNGVVRTYHESVLSEHRRDVVSVGLDGRSQPMWRYRDELHLPDHERSIVATEDRP